MIDETTGRTTTTPESRPAYGAGAGSYGNGVDHRGQSRRHTLDEIWDRGRPIGRERRGGFDTGLYIDDGIILLGLVLGGAAGYVAATTMRPGKRFTGRASKRPGYDGPRRERDTRYEPHVEDDETPELIASSKVEGTTVYDRAGQKIGTVHNFMVGKRTGRVSYAVLAVGGFLGVGERHLPVPWEVLDYDTDRKGYVVDADKDRLLHAPYHAVGEDAFDRGDYGEHVRAYWRASGGRHRDEGRRTRL